MAASVHDTTFNNGELAHHLAHCQSPLGIIGSLHDVLRRVLARSSCAAGDSAGDTGDVGQQQLVMDDALAVADAIDAPVGSPTLYGSIDTNA